MNFFVLFAKLDYQLSIVDLHRVDSVGEGRPESSTITKLLHQIHILNIAKPSIGNGDTHQAHSRALLPPGALRERQAQGQR